MNPLHESERGVCSRNRGSLPPEYFAVKCKRLELRDCEKKRYWFSGIVIVAADQTWLDVSAIRKLMLGEGLKSHVHKVRVLKIIRRDQSEEGAFTCR